MASLQSIIRSYGRSLWFSGRLIFLWILIELMSLPWRFSWDFLSHNLERHGFDVGSALFYLEIGFALAALPPVLYFFWAVSGEIMRGFKVDTEENKVNRR